ncbi:MAG: threonylcarbamoyl-AMP synthase [Treponema sp.]|nr:threonylcarbamoyl-AMP synthase [Treponema sp.]
MESPVSRKSGHPEGKALPQVYKKDEDSASIAAECLARGSIAILPTDTVYGFSGVVDIKGTGKKSTDSRIRRIKGRDEGKPFIQLIASPEEIWKYTDENISRELLDLWPGPLTIIVRLKEGSPLDIESRTVAFRCPGDSWLRQVIARLGRPVYSSSVNRSGRPVLSRISDIVEEFGKDVSMVVNDGDKDKGVPSTIVSVSDGLVRLVRQGALRLDGLSTAACP